EARVIAEDLVAREPWERSNIERFRRALTLLGEADIDAIIADRLSGQSPFLSTDFNWPADQEAAPPARLPSAPPAQQASQPAPAPPEPAEHAHAPADAPPPAAERKQKSARSGATSHAIDLSGILEEQERHEAAAPARAGAQ